MTNNSPINKRDFLLLWLINPFLSLIFLIRNFGRFELIWPFLLVSFYFGFSFVIEPGSNVDSTRYAQKLAVAFEKQYTFQEYILNPYLDEKDGELDIYQATITWVVSQFTSDYRWLFAIYATVFGYFWFRALLIIRQHLAPRLVFLSILVLVAVAVINPIWSINGVRMWTAIQLFFYGFLTIHLSNQTRKGWILMAVAPFIHFSLSIVLLVYLFYWFLPLKNLNLFFSFYIISLFISELDFDLIRQLFEKLPGFIQSRKVYLNEAYIEGLKDGGNIVAWHVKLAGNTQKYAMISLVIWMYIKEFQKKRITNSKFESIFRFTMFFNAIANLLTNVPSGERFMILAHLLTGLSFLIFLKATNQSFHVLLKPILKAALLIIIVFRIRVAMDHTGAFFFFGNPLINLLIIDDVPFITFVKALIS